MQRMINGKKGSMKHNNEQNVTTCKWKHHALRKYKDDNTGGVNRTSVKTEMAVLDQEAR